jgi:hypothetical protein
MSTIGAAAVIIAGVLLFAIALRTKSAGRRSLVCLSLALIIGPLSPSLPVGVSDDARVAISWVAISLVVLGVGVLGVDVVFRDKKHRIH